MAPPARRANNAATDTAQTPPASAAPQAPAADPKDVATMDAIVAALYDVISGPAGQKRNWDRFRSLFVPGARLIPTGRRPTGEVVSRVRTPEEYIQGSRRCSNRMDSLRERFHAGSRNSATSPTSSARTKRATKPRTKSLSCAASTVFS